MKKLFLSLTLLYLSLFASPFQNMDKYFEKNALSMMLIDPTTGKIVRINEAAATFYGYSKYKLETMNIKQINTFTKEQVQLEMQNAKKENRNFFVFRHRLSNGSIKRVKVYSQPILYNQKKLLFSTIYDISDLEIAHQELDYYNKTLEEQIDLKSKALIQEEIDKRNLFIGIFILELLIIGLLFKNIYKRKQVEKELAQSLSLVKASKTQLQEIINSFPIAIIKADPTFTHIDYLNQAFSSAFGWTKEDLHTTQDWAQKAYPNSDYREKVFNLWDEVVEQTKQLGLATSQYPIIVKVQCKNKEEKLCQLWYHQNNNDIYGFFYDITKQTQLEEKNLEQQKLLLTQAKIAAVGEMLGNIAHQWRQPLSSISSQVSGLSVQIDFGVKISNEDIKECSNNVMNQVKYLSSTIDDFKNFFTSDNDCVEPFYIKDTINKLHNLIKDTLNNNYIQCYMDVEDIQICYNENKLIQCLLNICNNAKDAIVSNEIPTEQRKIYVRALLKNEMVQIKVQDSGGGIKKEILDKIFEPYFTTKHKSVGTGIGLYMAYQMITTSFQGNIKVNNISISHNEETLKGTEFIIEFPLYNKECLIQ